VSDARSISLLRFDRVKLHYVDVFKAQITRNIRKFDGIIVTLMGQREATVVHDVRVNMFTSTLRIRPSQGRGNTPLLDLMEASIWSNSMRNLVIELTATGNDRRRD
jgi:hypothetical protein